MGDSILPFSPTADERIQFRRDAGDITSLNVWKQNRLENLRRIDRTIVFMFAGIKHLRPDSGRIGGGVTGGLYVRYRIQRRASGVTLMLYGPGWSSAVPVGCDGFLVNSVSTPEINIDPVDGTVRKHLLSRPGSLPFRNAPRRRAAVEVIIQGAHGNTLVLGEDDLRIKTPGSFLTPEKRIPVLNIAAVQVNRHDRVGIMRFSLSASGGNFQSASDVGEADVSFTFRGDDRYRIALMIKNRIEGRFGNPEKPCGTHA